MKVRAEDEMTVMIELCLTDLDEMEAAFLRDCYLHEPKIPLPTFAKRGYSRRRVLPSCEAER